jgi:putative hydrolase of the HAD superfamily
MAHISLVVFDLGGVMIRLSDGWEDACRLAGVAVQPGAPAWHEVWTAHAAELDEPLGCGRIDDDEFFRRFHRAIDGAYSIPELQAVFQAIIQPEFPGIMETVCALQAAGIRTACLSNTSAVHWVDLDDPAKYPAIGRLDARHASHLLGCMKPGKEIYRKFEDAMDTVPSRLLFFDDTEDNITAARTYGWNAVHITKDQPAVEQIHAGLKKYGIEINPGCLEYPSK